MSLEMLAYISIAGISMAYSIGMVNSYHGEINRSVMMYEYSGFVNGLDTAMLEGARSVSLYVPEGMCNSTAAGNELKTGYGMFYFVDTVWMNASAICSQGYKQLQLSYNGTGVMVE